MAMKGIKYERYLYNSLRKMGFDVKQQPGSGAGVKKGDLILEDFLVEVKTTTKKSYSLNKEVLEKVKGQAFRLAKKPVLIVSYDGDDWVVMRSKDFYEFLAELKEKRQEI